MVVENNGTQVCIINYHYLELHTSIMSEYDDLKHRNDLLISNLLECINIMNKSPTKLRSNSTWIHE